jgi:macrophage erythroblast attacher
MNDFVYVCVSFYRHARKYFTIFEDEQLQDVQHCVAQLAFPATTELSPYLELLDGSRWERLIEQFRQDNCRLLQLASQSVFTIALQAGLSALKTPYPLQIQQECLKYYFSKHVQELIH